MEATRDIEAGQVMRDSPVKPLDTPPALVERTGEAFGELLLCRDLYLELFWMGWFRWA